MIFFSKYLRLVMCFSLNLRLFLNICSCVIHELLTYRCFILFYYTVFVCEFDKQKLCNYVFTDVFIHATDDVLVAYVPLMCPRPPRTGAALAAFLARSHGDGHGALAAFRPGLRR